MDTTSASKNGTDLPSKRFRGPDMTQNESEIFVLNKMQNSTRKHSSTTPRIIEWTIVLGRYNQIIPIDHKNDENQIKRPMHNSRIVDLEDTEHIVLHSSTKSHAGSC
jgi:hypothetical protein